MNPTKSPMNCAWTSILVMSALGISSGAIAASADNDEVWLDRLRPAYFGDRVPVQSDDVIELEAPVRAENAAIVPIKIKAKLAQSEQLYIKTIYLFVDKNPGALAGKFHFTPKSGRADLALRVRVNEYTPMRAIAETNDGALYMSRRFVKASGGCSAPAGADLDAAMARLGRMKIKTQAAVGAEQPALAQLMVSHPNVTGMQMDQVTRHYSPAHYVNKVKVSYQGEEIFSAETDFSISENPSFRFYFIPQNGGELTAEVIDTNGLRFTHNYAVGPAGVAQN